MLVQSKDIIQEVVMQIEKSYHIRTALNITVKYNFDDVLRKKLWLDILHKISEDRGSCLILSLTISVHEMIFRLISALTEISVEQLLLGMLNNNEFNNLTDIAGYLFEAPFWFSCTQYCSEIEFDLDSFNLAIEIGSYLMTKKEYEDYNASEEWYVTR